jgi:addiction module RelE/StbE family toxin
MSRLVWSKTFVRAYRKLYSVILGLAADIEETLRKLVHDPFDPRLRTHKLKGKPAGTWACSVGYDLRLVFEFVKGPDKEDELLLIEIGTHEEVY